MIQLLSQKHLSYFPVMHMQKFLECLSSSHLLHAHFWVQLLRLAFLCYAIATYLCSSSNKALFSFRVLQLFFKIVSSGTEINLTTYSILLKNLLAAGKWRRCIEVFLFTIVNQCVRQHVVLLILADSSMYLILAIWKCQCSLIFKNKNMNGCRIHFSQFNSV